MKQKQLGKLISVLIPLVGIILIVMKDSILTLPANLNIPACPIYSSYHIYCPACGNTRSVTALLDGDLWSSLRYNAVPILLLIIAFLGYIELVTYSFGKHIRILPRKLMPYVILIIIVIIYWIVRNFSSYLTP